MVPRPHRSRPRGRAHDHACGPLRTKNYRIQYCNGPCLSPWRGQVGQVDVSGVGKSRDEEFQSRNDEELLGEPR